MKARAQKKRALISGFGSLTTKMFSAGGKVDDAEVWLERAKWR